MQTRFCEIAYGFEEKWKKLSGRLELLDNILHIEHAILHNLSSHQSFARLTVHFIVFVIFCLIIK